MTGRRMDGHERPLVRPVVGPGTPADRMAAHLLAEVRRVWGIPVAVLVLATVFTSAVLAHWGARTPFVRTALLSPSSPTVNRGRVYFAKALELLAPGTVLIWMTLWLEDLRPLGRAIWASYPPSPWLRSALWLGATIASYGLLLLSLPLLFVPAMPAPPWAAAAYVMPVVIWLAGVMYLVAEAFSAVEAGLWVAVGTAVAGYMLPYWIPAGAPRWWMLFAASRFPPGPALTSNRLQLAAAGLLAWFAGTALAAWQQRRGHAI